MFKLPPCARSAQFLSLANSEHQSRKLQQQIIARSYLQSVQVCSMPARVDNTTGKRQIRRRRQRHDDCRS